MLLFLGSTADTFRKVTKLSLITVGFPDIRVFGFSLLKKKKNTFKFQTVGTVQYSTLHCLQYIIEEKKKNFTLNILL